MHSPTIIIVDTAPYHLREMAEVMQSDSAEIAYRFGTTPLKALWHNYRQSIICKSVFINDNLCAIFGLAGVIFGDVGRPWICMTPEVQQYPMRVAFRFKAELKKMAEMFPILEDYIEENRIDDIRFMEIMGFRISKNSITVNNINFRHVERRA